MSMATFTLSDYDRVSDDFFSQLNDTEEAVIDFYTNYGFMDINKYMMGSDNSTTFAELANQLYDIIQKYGFNTSHLDTLLYRGTRMEHFADKAVGDTVKFPFFLSTTENAEVASRFARGDNPAVICFDNIDALFAPVSRNNEEEYLLESDAEFIITDILHDMHFYGKADKHVTLIRVTSYC